VRSWLDVPTFATRSLDSCHHARTPSGGRWNCGREMSGDFAEMSTYTPFRDLLHAVKLRHGTDGFTFPPKEDVLRIFFALKIRRLRPGANPRTWVPKASTLPLDHRSLSLLALKPTMGFSLLSDFLPFCSFFTLLSSPPYSHYLHIFFDILNPSFPWSPSNSRTYRFPL
jgi:hypothetical protein